MPITDIPSDGLPEPLQLMLQEFVNTISPILEWLSWLLGGLFGLYVVYFLIRLYFDRRKIKILKELHSDVEFLKKHSLSQDELEKLRLILDEYPKRRETSLIVNGENNNQNTNKKKKAVKNNKKKTAKSKNSSKKKK